MLKLKQYIQLIGILLIGYTLATCSEDSLSSETIFPKKEEIKTKFDEWLDNNYLNPFNVDVKYKLEDSEISYDKHYVPATVEASMKLSKIIKHTWVDAYVEGVSQNFLASTAPAIISYHGSGSWNADGTQTLGTAEGGLKINLFLVNWIDPTNVQELNTYYLHTMHHEFTHILHQTTLYPVEFNTISAGDYLPSGWYNRPNPNQYASLGFVSSYAGHSPTEDITEVTAAFLTYSDAQWQIIWNNAGTTGTAKLNEKIAIMKQYMLDAWGIDMDFLRSIVRQRMNEIDQLTLIETDWLPILAQSPSGLKDFEATKKRLTEEWGKAKEEMAKYPKCCQIHNAALNNMLNLNE